MVYAQLSTCPRKWHTETPMGLRHTNGSPISARRRDQHKKERICKIVDSAVPADDRIKLKECDKRDKYHDLAIYWTWKW